MKWLILLTLLFGAAAQLPATPTPGPYPPPYPGPPTATPSAPVPSPTATPTRTPRPTVPAGTPVCEECEPTAISVTLMEAKAESRPPSWAVAAALLIAVAGFCFRVSRQ